MVKSLALAVLLTNHARILPDPWLPFTAVCPRNRSNSSCSLSANSPVCVFNRRSGVDVQPPGPPGVTGAGIDDAARSRIVEGLLYYGNNKTFCGLIFFLTGLSTAGTPPVLVYSVDGP